MDVLLSGVYPLHPLDGPRLKLSVARNKIESLNHAIEGIKKINRKAIAVEFDEKTSYNVVYGQPVQPEDVWGVEIGEIAHDLRSALDGLTYQVAILSCQFPAGRTAFPIFRRKTTTLKRGNGDLIDHFDRDGVGKCLKSVDAMHHALFESHQPYKRGNTNDPMWLLHELNNADKHRIIQMGTLYFKRSYVGIRDISGDVVMVEGGKSHTKPRVLKGRTKLWEFKVVYGASGVESNVDMEFKMETEIVFAKGRFCKAIANRPVGRTLSRMHQRASEIIDSFAPLFPR